MIATVEVRWFRPGLLDADVQGWFSALPGPATHQPVRTDNYLKLPGEVALGIKIRAGRIEIKQQETFFGLVLFQQGVVGRVAGWRKWGFNLGDSTGEFSVTAQDMFCWTPVTKTRQLRRLRLTESGHFEPASPEHIISHGCDIEITEVRFDSHQWWTLAIEAYGLETQRIEYFTQAASELLETPLPGRLHERDSLSYPAWLEAHSAGGGRAT